MFDYELWGLSSILEQRLFVKKCDTISVIKKCRIWHLNHCRTITSWFVATWSASTSWHLHLVDIVTILVASTGWSTIANGSIVWRTIWPLANWHYSVVNDSIWQLTEKLAGSTSNQVVVSDATWSTTIWSAKFLMVEFVTIFLMSKLPNWLTTLPNWLIWSCPPSLEELTASLFNLLQYLIKYVNATLLLGVRNCSNLAYHLLACLPPPRCDKICENIC